MHTGLQWKFIRYKQQTDDYYAFINVTSILHLYYIVMFCSVLKHINPRQMHVNANHVKFPFNGMPLYNIHYCLQVMTMLNSQAFHGISCAKLYNQTKR